MSSIREQPHAKTILHYSWLPIEDATWRKPIQDRGVPKAEILS